MPGSRPAAERARIAAKPKLRITALLFFLALHVPLGIAMKLVPFLSTIHALASLAVALVLVVRRYPMALVVAACAYLVGSEALWRMTEARVFWEFGKYALLLVVVSALGLRRQGIASFLPVPYLLLLVPGVLLTIIGVPDLGELRQILSFELSGPVAFAVCGIFLLGRNLSRDEVLRSLAAMLAPIASVAALTFFGIYTTDIQFGASSSFDASGGFGPNQVAAALALGMVVCFLLLTGRRGPLPWRVALTGLIVWFGTQAALTLSRTGLYYSVAAILAGTAFLVADLRRFVLVVVVGLTLAGLGRFVIAPQLDAFTEGAVGARFARTDLSGREDLMKGDIMVFLRHPVFGVGAGMSREARREAVGAVGKNHTEFTRLLSEHGLLGAAALVLMLVMSGRVVWFQTTGWPRAFSASLVAFALIFMAGSGMRLAIPSFLLAFAGVRIFKASAGRSKKEKVGPWQTSSRRRENPAQRSSADRLQTLREVRSPASSGRTHDTEIRRWARGVH
jgi:O-Antigen ligase